MSIISICWTGLGGSCKCHLCAERLGREETGVTFSGEVGVETEDSEIEGVEESEGEGKQVRDNSKAVVESVARAQAPAAPQLDSSASVIPPLPFLQFQCRDIFNGLHNKKGNKVKC